MKYRDLPPTIYAVGQMDGPARGSFEGCSDTLGRGAFYVWTTMEGATAYARSPAYAIPLDRTYHLMKMLDETPIECLIVDRSVRNPRLDAEPATFDESHGDCILWLRSVKTISEILENALRRQGSNDCAVYQMWDVVTQHPGLRPSELIQLYQRKAEVVAKSPDATAMAFDWVVRGMTAKGVLCLPSCNGCGEAAWKVESVSPSDQAAQWRCGFCGNGLLMRCHETPEPQTQLRPPIPKAVKREVWQRDSGRCVECGTNENLEFDHIIPFSRGGSSTVRNLQLLCEGCNRAKATTIG